MSTTSEVSKRPRFWQFSLRGLLLLMVYVAILLGVVAWARTKIQQAEYRARVALGRAESERLNAIEAMSVAKMEAKRAVQAMRMAQKAAKQADDEKTAAEKFKAELELIKQKAADAERETTPGC